MLNFLKTFYLIIRYICKKCLSSDLWLKVLKFSIKAYPTFFWANVLIFDIWATHLFMRAGILESICNSMYKDICCKKWICWSTVLCTTEKSVRVRSTVRYENFITMKGKKVLRIFSEKWIITCFWIFRCNNCYELWDVQVMVVTPVFRSKIN